jgi:hypothetical protein
MTFFYFVSFVRDEDSAHRFSCFILFFYGRSFSYVSCLYDTNARSVRAWARIRPSRSDRAGLHTLNAPATDARSGVIAHAKLRIAPMKSPR